MRGDDEEHRQHLDARDALEVELVRVRAEHLLDVVDQRKGADDVDGDVADALPHAVQRRSSEPRRVVPVENGADEDEDEESAQNAPVIIVLRWCFL